MLRTIEVILTQDRIIRTKVIIIIKITIKIKRKMKKQRIILKILVIKNNQNKIKK